MSKTLFEETLGDAEIDFDCPECDKSFNIEINQIGTTVTCPNCGAEFFIEGSGDGLDSVKDSFDELEKTIDSFN